MRRTRTDPQHETRFVAADGTERALSGGALAILGDHLHGDWRRAWPLVDAFEREFLPPLNVREEVVIAAAAVAVWIEARGR